MKTRPIAVLVVLLAVAAGCTDPGGADRGPIEDRQVIVVATTGMVADVVRNVGGERVEVEALMGPGIDPHSHKASAKDLERLRGADLIALNGLYLEGTMAKVLSDLARTRTVIAIAEGTPEDRLLAPADSGGHPDPHIWFDVALWAETPRRVAEALAKLDPDHAKAYRDRAVAYRLSLLDLDRDVRLMIAKIPRERRVLVTSHDAFRYFGRAYDIDVTGLQGVSTVVEAGIQDRRRLVDLIIERGVKAIFVESSVSPKAIQAVRGDCVARGYEVAIGGTLYSDAMGAKAPDDTYVGMVRANVTRIVEALK